MKDSSKNIQLGIFVLTGTILFILALYLVGSKKNIFGSNIKIKAKFKNVNGLMEGNNVRFGGIDIGSIEKINIISDSNVCVEMWVEKSAGNYIRKNYIAYIGTDGLMGNRLVNIHPEFGKSPIIDNGDELKTVNPLETEDMLRAFNATGINMKSITENLNAVTIKIKDNNALWELLAKKEVAFKIEDFINSLNTSGKKIIHISNEIENYTSRMNNQNSLLSKISGNEYADKISMIMEKIVSIEDSTKALVQQTNKIAQKINTGNGTISKILNDSTTSHQFNLTLTQIQKSAKVLEDDLIGLQSSFILKRYFKKKIKERKTGESANK